MTARDPVRLGFMPLLDAAIPIVAARQGFAGKHGIELELVRETSWANVRDRLAIGHFDAAHLLAPLPIASALGLLPFSAPLIAPMTLGQGGNAITLASQVWEEMLAADPQLIVDDPASTGNALAHAIRRRRDVNSVPLQFAVVHPYSSHNYELRYWLAAAGIDPDRDVSIAMLPPPYMSDALEAGHIDGFCVGEPWNSVSVLSGAGRIIQTKRSIWPTSPDKVLALRADWAADAPDWTHRLLLAMLEASAFCADPQNHAALIDILSAPDALDVAAEALRPALSGLLTMADGVHAIPDIIDLSPRATRPDASAFRWYQDQMIRWRQAPGAAAQLDLTDLLKPQLRAVAMQSLGYDDAPEMGASPQLFDAALPQS